jgi:hypothetical protein
MVLVWPLSISNFLDLLLETQLESCSLILFGQFLRFADRREFKHPLKSKKLLTTYLLLEGILTTARHPCLGC